MATRSYFAKLKAVGGILIPAGAGANKYAISDAEGNLSWGEPKRKTSSLHAWSIQTPAVEELPGIGIEAQTGEKLFLVAIRVRTSSGECEIELKRNAAGVTSLTAVKVKSSAERIEANSGTPIELTNGDYFTLNIKANTAAKGLSVTLVIRSEA